MSGLLLLPLAPVRGTVWLAERVQEQAEQEMYDEDAIQAQLMELEAARAAGDITDDELEAAQDALLERLLAARGMTQEETGGGVER